MTGDKEVALALPVQGKGTKLQVFPGREAMWKEPLAKDLSPLPTTLDLQCLPWAELPRGTQNTLACAEWSAGEAKPGTEASQGHTHWPHPPALF